MGNQKEEGANKVEDSNQNIEDITEPLSLAQFYHAESKVAFEILNKKLDLNYSLPENTLNHGYSGYTLLHFAVQKSDLNAVKFLLEHGVDFTKQGIQNAWSPLHIAIYCNNILDLQGKIQGNEIVNSLLTSHVSSQNSFNPADKCNFTHLHIACIANHSEAIDFFFKNGKPVDQVVNKIMKGYAGYTPIHFAIRYSSLEAVEILLKYGADIYQKNDEGLNALNLLVTRLIEIVHGKLLTKKYSKSFDRNSEMKALQLIATRILKSRADFVDDTGLSALHLACMLRDESFVENLLLQNVNLDEHVKIDSRLWAGYTALHFAACFNVRTVKLLLKQGANFVIKNADRETALDFCIKRYHPAVMFAILSETEVLKNITLSNGTVKLTDLFLAMRDNTTLDRFLQNVIDVNVTVSRHSPIWPGYSLLHLAVISARTRNVNGVYNIAKSGPKKLFKYHNKDVEKLYLERLNLCLRRGAHIYLQDVNLSTPIHLAFLLRAGNALRILLNHNDENEFASSFPRDANNLSLLHIACAVNKKHLVESLVERGADINSTVKCNFKWFSRQRDENDQTLLPVRTNSTPLHIAVIFENKKIVEFLLKKGADMYAQDDLDLTPIHLSMASATMSSTIAELMLKEKNLKDSVSKHGLSHLHVAMYANDGAAISKLCKLGASINKLFEINRKEDSSSEDFSYLTAFNHTTPIDVALMMKSTSAFSTAVRSGLAFSVNCKIKASLLKGLVDDTRIDFSLTLKGENRTPKDIDETGLTPLHSACANFDKSLVTKLLKKGAAINAQVYEEKNSIWAGRTPLFVLIHQAVKLEQHPRDFLGILKLLLKNGADCTIKAKNTTPLHEACADLLNNKDPVPTTDDADSSNTREFLIAAADLMIKSQKYNVNPANDCGFSHFHYACLRNDTVIVENFLEAGNIDIDERINFYHKTCSGFTPLHLAIRHKSEKVARLLIIKGADVKAVDSFGNTPLHAIISKGILRLDFMKLLLSNGADINAKNLKGETPLELLLKSKNSTNEHIEFFLNNTCSIDIINSVTSEGLIGMLVSKQLQNLVYLFRRFIDACQVSSSDCNTIHSVVANDTNGELLTEDYVYAIEKLLELGCDIEQRNARGLTPLHTSVRFKNVEATTALLILGADLNATNKNGQTPYTLELVFESNLHCERESMLIETFSMHIWKMAFVQLEVSEFNQQSNAAVPKKYSFDETKLSMKKRRCEEELQKMENFKFKQDFSLKDFLSKSKLESGFKNISTLQKQTITEFFIKPSTNIIRKFPEIGSFLLMMYRKYCIEPNFS